MLVPLRVDSGPIGEVVDASLTTTTITTTSRQTHSQRHMASAEKWKTAHDALDRNKTRSAGKW